jgi:polyferredoxin
LQLMAKHKTSFPVLLRRLTQTLFLLLFVYLFYRTAYHPDNASGGPTAMFFNLDPLIMLTMWIGGHAVASALFLSLITLAATLVFGRWFCGWVCPFGALNNLFTSMRKGRKEKIKTSTFSTMQKAKYYIVAAVLVGSFFGVNMAGWLDPFSFLFRSFTTVVFPVVNAGIQGAFDWAYNVNPLGLKTVSEPVYRGFRYYFLTLSQPHYYWGMMFGVLFGTVLLLNLFRARFWCRYICPLGGLLGIIGKNPILRVNVDADKCKNCMECVAECQGGSEPQSNETWKPAECMFCWNCHSACPVNAISFNFKTPGVKS